MRKYAKRLHLWLALPFGVILTLVCFSGAVLAFEKEFKLAATDISLRRKQPDVVLQPAPRAADNAAVSYHGKTD